MENPSAIPSRDARGQDVAHRDAIAAELRSRIQRVRGTMSDERFETLLDRMVEQRIADELRDERP